MRGRMGVWGSSRFCHTSISPLRGVGVESGKSIRLRCHLDLARREKLAIWHEHFCQMAAIMHTQMACIIDLCCLHTRYHLPHRGETKRSSSSMEMAWPMACRVRRGHFSHAAVWFFNKRGSLLPLNRHNTCFPSITACTTLPLQPQRPHNGTFLPAGGERRSSGGVRCGRCFR